MPTLPPGIDLSDDKSDEIIGYCMATWVIAFLSVALRFVSRWISKTYFSWDDWLMLVALVATSVISFLSSTWMIQCGAGKHVYALPPAEIPDDIRKFLIGTFIAEIGYTVTMVAVKLSILAMYWRIFQEIIKRVVLVLMGLVASWGIAVFLITIFQCVPVRGFWDKSINPSCGVDDYHFFIGNSIPNTVTDLLILAAPTPAIWKLQMPTSQKLLVSGIFLLGGLIIAVSIVRLVILLDLDLQSEDVTWQFYKTIILTCVEMNIAVLCGCLPVLRPVLNWVLTGSPQSSPGSRGTKTDFSNAGATGGSSSWNPLRSQTQASSRTPNDEIGDDDTRPFAETGSNGHGMSYGETLEMKGVMRSDTIDVRSDPRGS